MRVFLTRRESKNGMEDMTHSHNMAKPFLWLAFFIIPSKIHGYLLANTLFNERIITDNNQG